jgi:hypothetical protein
MFRPLTSSLFAFLITFLLIGGAGSAFAATELQYRAEPATPPAAARLIVKDLVWKCGPAGCVAGKSNSRPAIDCSALVREVGPLKSFAVAGRALDSAALEKCNARAR